MISFFANPHGSGEIRGRQMAVHLEARLNPVNGHEDDVCIWVKRQPPEDYPKRSYLDVVDGEERLEWLRAHPDMGVIACSRPGQQFLEIELGREVIFIPQHHCNFQRELRIDRRLANPRLGFVGGEASVAPFAAEVGIVRYEARSRLMVLAAYRQIDIQVLWKRTERNRPLKNPLKIVNAASFGVPTIAYPEVGFEEARGYYWPACSKEEVLYLAGKLSRGGYDPEKLRAWAEDFHIERIAELYRRWM